MKLLVVGSVLPQGDELAMHGGAEVLRCRESYAALQSGLQGKTVSIVFISSSFIERNETDVLQLVNSCGVLPIIVLRTAPQDDGLRFILEGCAGVVPPDVSAHDLAGIVVRVAAGEICASTAVLSRAIRQLLDTSHQALLTRRERQIFDLVSAGFTNQQIADKLYVSRETIRWHMRSIRAKLGPQSVQRIRKSRSESSGAVDVITGTIDSRGN